MRTRALTLKEVGRVRRALAPLRELHTEPGELARVLRLPRARVEVVLTGEKFPSMGFASAVAAATSQSIAKLLSTPSRASPDPE